MRRGSRCPLVYFWLAMLTVLVDAPDSMAAQKNPDDPSANKSAGAIRTVIQEPVVSLKAVQVEGIQTYIERIQEPQDRRCKFTSVGREGTASSLASVPSLAQQAPPGTPRELLPDLGQIGAQVSLLLGVSTTPFKADNGFLAGGHIDLPLFKVGGGKISYQIAVTNQRATTDVRITSPLSAVGDLLAADGLGGTLTSRVLSSLKDLPAEEDLDLLTVLPLGLKYTITRFDHHRLRPYIVGAFGIYVTITEQDPELTIDPRLVGPFIGGIAPEAIELTARGVPEGQGDIRFGGNVGGGVEYRFIGRSSLGFEYRFHKAEGTSSDFSTFAGKLGFHF